MKKTIYDLALECQKVKNDDTNIKYTKIINRNNGSCYDDYTVSGNIEKYERSLKVLASTIKQKYPHIYEELTDAMQHFESDRAGYYIVIGTIVDILVGLEDVLQNNSKKIFISHSSKDKEIVKWFVKEILHSGIGISYDDICCTSIEGLNVRQGDDIRRHIHDNIKGADFSFLMISENYKASEICLNEMGAVWAYDANVRAFILPNTDFKSIGWLNDPKEAKPINCSISLDALKDELVEYYSLKDPKTNWSRGRQDFLDNLNMLRHLQEI